MSYRAVIELEVSLPFTVPAETVIRKVGEVKFAGVDVVSEPGGIISYMGFTPRELTKIREWLLKNRLTVEQTFR